MIRIIVTGSRDLDCHPLALAIVTRLEARYGDGLVICHGDCRGVDKAFDAACRELGVAVEPHPADWDAHGKAAGPLRNARMVAAGADLAIAVHPDLTNSKGTLDCVRRALAAGIPTWWVTCGLEPLPKNRLTAGEWWALDTAEPAAIRRLTAEDLT